MNLEARFGAALFRFVGRELSLTEAGAALYRYASAAAAEGRKTEALIASLGKTIPIRFGAARTIGEYVLPSCLAGYLRENPDTDISRVVDNTDVLLGRLKEGSIDFAFIEGIFEREGVNIPRAIQAGWMMQVYEGTRLLEGALRQALFESDVLFTDDTPVPFPDQWVPLPKDKRGLLLFTKS